MKQNNSQIKGWAVALTVFLIIALAIVGCVFNNSFVKKTDDHSIQKENSDNTTTVDVPADTGDSKGNANAGADNASSTGSSEQQSSDSDNETKSSDQRRGNFVDKIDGNGKAIYVEELKGNIN